MSLKSPVKIRSYLAKRIRGAPNKERAMLAYRDALRRSGSDSDVARRRIIFSEFLKQEKSSDPLRARTMSLALKNATPKYGQKSALSRELNAQLMRETRTKDRENSWGVSFEAGLKQVNEFFHPINLVQIIDSYSKSKKDAPVSVLEIGAGKGMAASDLAGLLGRKVSVTATGLAWLNDWSKQKNATNVSWKVAHSENLRRVVKSGAMDVVYSNLGLAHSTNIDVAFSEMQRVLRRKGVLIFSADRDILANKSPSGFSLLEMHEKEIVGKSQGEKVKLFVYVLRKK